MIYSNDDVKKPIRLSEPGPIQKQSYEMPFTSNFQVIIQGKIIKAQQTPTIWTIIH